MKSALTAYLAKHAETAAREIADRFVRRRGNSSLKQADNQTDTHKRALVIPCYDEPTTALQKVLQNHPQTLDPSSQPDTLVIAVVNAPHDAPAAALKRTQEFHTYLQKQSSPHLLLIDCTQPKTMPPSEQGVGLARKIGTDVAAHLYQSGHLKSPWVYQTDADAVLPNNYFDTVLPEKGAVVVGHHHVAHSSDVAPTSVLQRAAELYEWHMAYYHTSLAKAGSRYAYPTLGSTIIVHLDSYAAVRGFPKRNAGEDFYLLNKIAKVAPVQWNPECVIELQARPSQRVPFGTGPVLATISAGLQAQPDGSLYHSYHPNSFLLLQEGLESLNDLSQRDSGNLPITSSATQLLFELGLDRVLPNIQRQHTNAQRRLNALTDWFDAKRTLRFIHLARRHYPDQPLLTTLSKLPKTEQKRIGFTHPA